MRPECRPIFIFVRETGCRREEVLSLRRWQVQNESRLVVFNENTKSRRYRYAPLTDAALEAVAALPPLEGCPYVFYNRALESVGTTAASPGWKRELKQAFRNFR